MSQKEYAQVVLSKVSPGTDKEYSYKIPQGLQSKASVGLQVLIPFGRARAVGYITKLLNEAPQDIKYLKEILAFRSEFPIFSSRSVDTARWLSGYYCCLFGSALRLFLPPGIEANEKISGKKRIIIEGSGSKVQSPRLKAEAENCKPVLLFNMGPTKRINYYIEETKVTLSGDRDVTLLLPEIGHENRIIESFKENFGDLVAVIHSNMSEKERFEEWSRISSGKARIAIGTRSAVFAPVNDPGLIIIDEESEFTYKSEQTPKYHVREVALFLAKESASKVILSSSNPSVESFYRAKTGVYLLKEDADGKKEEETEISIVDVKEERSRQLSLRLKEEIGKALEAKEPIMLIQNRRGYAPFLVCNSCGNAIECPNCSLSLAYHSPDSSIRCNRCGFISAQKIACPKCLSHSINYFGAGTQKIESEIGRLFPGIKTIRIDKDNISSKKSANIALEAFVEDEAQVLIGTQMILKALPKKKFGLVAVISADASLNCPDFRAAESTFDFLFQLHGGSSDLIPPRKVIIQTLNPQHYAIICAVEHDYNKFYETEIASRRDFGYPPFSSLINIVFSGKDREAVHQKALSFSGELKAVYKDIEILGPVKAPIEKLRGMTRYQMLIKGKDLDMIKVRLKAGIKEFAKDKEVRVNVDVDPANLG